jgi:DNA-binding response OmpR family regulator
LREEKTAKKKILVIDGMPRALAMIKARLEASGYEILVAPDGERGLALAAAEKPDLVILDVVMSAPEGYSPYSGLKMSPATRSVPVIFLTATDRPEDVSRAYLLGAQYCVKKPYRPEVLLDTVEKALNPPVFRFHSGGLPRRVLVMGMESEAADFMKLGEMGYRVTSSPTLREGSKEAQKERPDVILLDGMLVKSNDYDGFYQLQLEFASSHIPMILFAAKEELEEFRKRLEGFDRYCLKPFKETDLLGSIRMALQKD